MAERLIYLNDFTDEVMPCPPSLEAWADWLAKPDPSYGGREEPTADGALFAAYAADLLGDVRVDRNPGGGLVFTPDIPAGAEIFAKRHHEGGEGWDAEYMAETPEDALDCLDADDFPVWLACIKNGERGLVVRFHAGRPRCEVLAEAAQPDPAEPARPIRIDLALGALRALATGDVHPDVARALALAGIDFLTGDYEALEDEPACIACDLPLAAGQPYYSDASGGLIHAACCGPERESYTRADGEPLGPDDPIPAPSIWPGAAGGHAPALVAAHGLPRA